MENTSSTAIEKADDLVFLPVKYEDTQLDLARFKKVPLSELASFGAGLAELISGTQVGETTVTISGEGLYRAIVPEGMHLAEAKGKIPGFRGALVKDGAGVMGQAVFQNAGDLTATIESGVPVDPVTLAIVVALAGINERLDQIEQTQQAMFDYMKNENRADLQADFKTLDDIKSSYKFNLGNPTYKQDKHILVQTIKRNSEKHLLHHRAQVEAALAKKGLVHTGIDAQKALENVIPELNEYRIALYLYSASSFFEVLLLENQDQNYLESVASQIEQKRLEYRSTYTACYDRLEDLSRSAVEGKVLHGLSLATKAASKAIAKTPIGERTSIDEGLEQASSKIGNFNKGRVTELLKELPTASDCDVSPFAEQVRNVNLLLNRPVEMLSDGKVLYYRQLEAPSAMAGA